MAHDFRNHALGETMRRAGLGRRPYETLGFFRATDLSILGSTPDVFAVYEDAVRREYGWVPDALWCEGRRKVLQGFLDRPAIFASPQFRASHEAAARANLMHSLERLLEGQAHP